MTKVALLNDQELITLYKSGSEWAFAELLKRHKSKVYSTIYLLVRDREQAEDLFQEAFIRIIDILRAGKYTEEGRFGGFAVRVARNLTIDYLRAPKHKGMILLEHDHDFFKKRKYHADNGEEAFIRSEMHEQLLFLLDSLPADQREVVVLRHFADLSFKEIAEATASNLSTVLGRMRYALRHIRTKMQQNPEQVVDLLA